MSQRHKTTGRSSFDRILRDPGEDLPEARLLSLDQINHNPAQFRQSFNPDTIRELANSIAEQGLIEPIVVRPKDGRFEIVAGERRYRALLLLAEEDRGIDGVPAVIRELSDPAAALIIATENLQREDFTIADEAVMYERLITLLELDVERSNRELARRLGVNHIRISRVRRLAKYPALLAQVVSGATTMVQALDRIKDIEDGIVEEPPPTIEVGREEVEQISDLFHDETLSTEIENSLLPTSPFTTQHVAAHERIVPGKAWAPFYKGRENFEKFWNNDPFQLVRSLEPAAAEQVKTDILQERERLDRLLEAFERQGETVLDSKQLLTSVTEHSPQNGQSE